MGQQLSTFGLLLVILITAVLSSLGAHYSHEKDWQKCKIYSFVSASLAILSALFALFIMISIHSRPVGGAVASAEAISTIGLTMSFVFLILALITVGVLNLFAGFNAKDGASGSEKYNVWATLVSALSFLFCCFLIIFLL